MAQDLHNSLGHIDKVVWVEDCVGLSSLMAVAFNKIYMSEGARLYGLQSLHDITQGWADEDVREKMEAAREGRVERSSSSADVASTRESSVMR